MSNIMACAVVEENVITFDCDMNERGDPVYRISWYRNGKWGYARYNNFRAAYTTWKMLNRML